MNNPQLWLNLCAFKLNDEPDATIQFSDKLQKEEKWTLPFTNRAIAEYKKFLYLCVILPQGASPSEQVDKVWHLHLTYTVSYWQKLCGEVLKKQLHHYPSKGGPSENTRHQHWYKETLIAYVQEFEELPPVDFWPIPKDLNLNEYLPAKSPFRLPEFDIKPLFESTGYWQIGAGLLGIMSLIMFSSRGPNFLWMYALMAVWALWGVYLRTNYKAKVLETSTLHLHPYQFATIFKNTETTFRTIVTDLADRSLLTYADAENFRYATDSVFPLLNNVQAQDADTLPVTDLREILYPSAKAIARVTSAFKDKLTGQGSIITLFCWWVGLAGLARIIIGISNGKPVLFLLLLLIFYILGWIISGQVAVIDTQQLKSDYQRTDWGGQITTAALAYMVLDSTYSLANNQSVNGVFQRHARNDDATGWLGGATVVNGNKSGGDGGGGGCSSGGGDGGGGCSGGGCGGCGGCGGS